MYMFCVHDPLVRLYMEGPEVHGFGGWGGLDHASICNRLSGGYSAMVAAPSAEVCEAFIARRQEAFVLGVVWCAGLVIVVRVLSSLWSALLWRHCVMQPLMLEVRRALALRNGH
jgi:hypothetical protein